MNEYIGCFKKYATFAGRATRREYWMFVLFNFLVSFGISFVVAFVGAIVKTPEISALSNLYTIAAILPSWAVCVRRLHDIGKSGWWLLLSLIPIIGWIVLIVFYCQDSQPGVNAWGENPNVTR